LPNNPPGLDCEPCLECVFVAEGAATFGAEVAGFGAVAPEFNELEEDELTNLEGVGEPGADPAPPTFDEVVVAIGRSENLLAEGMHGRILAGEAALEESNWSV
jgi:hypothetical protein